MINKKKELDSKLIEKHNLTKSEYKEILKILNRPPNILELGIFSVMWSEHCSYKSTKKWLKTLPTTAPWVICGPGENAGIVDIEDEDAIVFKMESHNHPSFIEPYQGAATGVGGILRDIFTMGARPIANLNSLRFGSPENSRTKHLINGVVAGIGDYGNCIGIPTVGGECFFHECYNNNILVNAMSVGLVKKNKIFYSVAKGVGYPVFYVGAKTGRDGIHGATMASAEFDEKSTDNRPQVQIGDPFTEKLLLEACLELMETDAIVAIQDMGAAGLTSSSFEMASKGNLGINLYLDKVPLREKGMTPYEIMLSETQERMLIIIDPKFKLKAFDIFGKWGLDIEEIGVLNQTGKMKIYFNDTLNADLPIEPLAESSPEYSRAYKAPNKKKKVYNEENLNTDIKKSLLGLLSSPNFASKKWIFNQYDQTVMGDTFHGPEEADSAVIRVHGSKKAIALTSDCNPIFCKYNPYLGSMLAVTETWRNLCAVGAKPLAITDNLNFGNPEKKEIMYEIMESVRGIKDACKTLNYPVVSGNVSLYNETNGKSIYPTPVIGGLGLINDYSKSSSIKLKHDSSIFIVGKTYGHIELSSFQTEILKIENGDPPPIDFGEEIKNGNFIRELIAQEDVIGTHDVSDGGIIIALSEMIIQNNIGMELDLPKEIDIMKWLFGEDQSRYIVITKNDEKIMNYAEKKKVFIEKIGNTRGDSLTIKNNFKISNKELININNKWFKNYCN